MNPTSYLPPFDPRRPLRQPPLPRPAGLQPAGERPPSWLLLLPDPPDDLVDRAPGRLLLLAAGCGLVFDVGLRGGLANAVVVAAIALVVVALLTDGRAQTAQARGLTLAALAPAVGLGLRASPWLQATNLLAVVGLLAGAVLFARSGSVLDTSPLRLAARLGPAIHRSLWAPLALRGLAARRSRRGVEPLVRVGLAALFALPVLGIVVALLASADAVFASLVVPDVDLGPVFGHVALAGLLGFLVLCGLAGSLGDGQYGVPRGRFGAIEVTTMLGLTAAVLGLYVVAQLVALTGAGERLVEEAGLTPAEYARSGFFQLCWATAVLLGFLALVKGLAAPGVTDGTVVRVLGAAVPVLALGLVVVSLRRMALYDEAFGLTMLRLWVVGAALWMGAVLVMVALRSLGVGGDRNWVVAGAGAAGLALVLGGNALNPEAFVVRHNVDRAEEGAELDTSYLQWLSSDATPAVVVAWWEETDPNLRRDLREAVDCDDTTGAAALNLAVAQAADARRDICGR